MADRASEALLASLHNAVAVNLLAKVNTGDATAQELSAAIKFLKDNGIEACKGQSDAITKLQQSILPIFEDDDGYDERPYTQ